MSIGTRCFSPSSYGVRTMTKFEAEPDSGVTITRTIEEAIKICKMAEACADLVDLNELMIAATTMVPRILTDISVVRYDKDEDVEMTFMFNGTTATVSASSDAHAVFLKWLAVREATPKKAVAQERTGRHNTGTFVVAIS